MEFPDNIPNALKTNNKGSLTITRDNNLSEKYSRGENQRNLEDMYNNYRSAKSSENSDKFSFFTKEEDLNLYRALLICNRCNDPY